MWALLWSDARTFGIHKQTKKNTRRNKNSSKQTVSVNPCEPCCRKLSVIDNSEIKNNNSKKKLYLKSSIKVIKQVNKTVPKTTRKYLLE